MRTSTFLFPLLLLASSTAFAAPSSTRSSPTPLRNDLSVQGIGEEAQRRNWRRQLASSSGIQWTLAQTESTSSAASTSTEATTTTSTEASSTAETSSAAKPASTDSDSETSSTLPVSSASSLASSSSSSSSSATTTSPRSTSSSATLLPSSVIPAQPSSTVEALHTNNIFSKSSKLFAVGVVVILAIIVLSAIIAIFTIKRCMHRPRFIDPLDYPEDADRRWEKNALSKGFSRTSQVGMLEPAQLSPNSSLESYEADKGDYVGQWSEEKNEVSTLARGRGGQTINSPNTLAPPPPTKPFTNLAPLPSRSGRIPPPVVPINLTAPSYPSNANSPIPLPQRAERALPPTAPRATRHRPSYVSTLPLAPTLTASASDRHQAELRSFSTTPPKAKLPAVPSTAKRDERYTSLPSSSSPRHGPRRSIPSSVPTSRASRQQNALPFQPPFPLPPPRSALPPPSVRPPRISSQR